MRYFIMVIFVVAIIVALVFSFQKKQSISMAVSNQGLDKSKSKDLPFKYLVVSGKEAIQTCLKLRGDEKAITPVIYGDKENAQRLFEAYDQDTTSPNSIIEKASNFDINEFIKTRTEADPELYSDQELIGEWPTSPVSTQKITANTDILTGKLLNEVYIGLIPTDKPYDVAAYIKYGGWNECPYPEDHVGIMKYWYEKYGAKIISITPDTIEFTVENPPKTKEEALALAKEQFVYCSDIVTQGTGSISDLAASLLNSKYWFFWWD